MDFFFYTLWFSLTLDLNQTNSTGMFSNETTTTKNEKKKKKNEKIDKNS